MHLVKAEKNKVYGNHDEMSNWKVQESEMPRWNYLAGKIDALATDLNSPKMTGEEVVEFLSIWYRETYKPTDPFVKRVMKDLNSGDNDILFK